MDRKKFDILFPIGAHLCRSTMPDIGEMIHDIGVLKANGFNLIKIQDSWSMSERKEGIYDFKILKQLIECARKNDLAVYLGLSMEHAPKWLWDSYEDAYMVDSNGQKLLYQAQQTIPADGKPGPCFDGPNVKIAQKRYITELVRELGDFENIVVWNTWQEMGYEAERLTGHKVCYCDNTLLAFEKWLVKKFKTIQSLNYCFKSFYSDFDEVVPNRDIGRFCQVNNIVFEYYLNNIRIAEIIKERNDIIRDIDKFKRPVFSHQGSSTVGSGVDWCYSRTGDLFAYSCYPTWFHKHEYDDLCHESLLDPSHSNLLNEIWDSVVLKFDYLRACTPANHEKWAAEFQGGAISTGIYKGRVPSADDIRRWMLSAVSCGVNGISFWVARMEIQGHEVNGYSLLDSVGDKTERFAEAGRIAKALNRHADLFKKGNLSQSQVAIIVNEWNYLLCGQLKGDAEKHLAYSTRGWHRVFWDLSVPTDFVEMSQFEEEYVQNYKLLILPFPFSISEEYAQKLSRYVENGGVIISEACPGRLSEWGFANRGELSPTMAKLFGVVHKGLSLIDENNGRRWKMDEYSFGDYAPFEVMKGIEEFEGEELNPHVYIEWFGTNGSKAILSCSKGICGTKNNFGMGESYLIGTILGHSGTAYKDDKLIRFMTKLLDKIDISYNKAGKLLLRTLQKDETRVYCLTNPMNETVVQKVNVIGSKATTIFDEMVPINNGTINVTLKPLEVQIIICEKN